MDGSVFVIVIITASVFAFLTMFLLFLIIRLLKIIHRLEKK